MSKILTCLITLYNKPINELSRAIESLKNYDKYLNVILIYKNSKKYNYDNFLKSYSAYEIIKLDNDSLLKKNGSILRAAKQIHTKYFFILDPDDYVEGKIKELTMFLKKRENVDIFSNQFMKFKHKKIGLAKTFNAPFFNASLIYKTETIKQIDQSQLQHFDVSHPMDIALNLQLQKQKLIKKIEYINFPFYVYVVNSSESASNNVSIDFKNDLINLLTNYKDWKFDKKTRLYQKLFWWLSMSKIKANFVNNDDWKDYKKNLYELMKKTNIGKWDIFFTKFKNIYFLRNWRIKKYKKK